VAIIAGACTNNGSGTGDPRVDFTNFANQVKSDLATCTNLAGIVQIELGGYLTNPDSTSFNLVQLDSDTKSAQTACDDAKDDRLLSLASLNPPSSISDIQSLNGVAMDALNWATNDTTAVLHDLQRLAETTGSQVAVQSQLSTDVAQADRDAAIVNYEFSNAANRLGIRRFGGLGLVSWESGSGANFSPTANPTTTAPLPLVVDCTIYGQPTQPPASKPTQLFLDCGGSQQEPVTDISWSSWTTTSAIGTGTLTLDNCEPTCAGGATETYPANIVLADPGMTPYGQDFQSVTVSYNDGTRSQTIREQLPEVVPA